MHCLPDFLPSSFFFVLFALQPILFCLTGTLRARVNAFAPRAQERGGTCLDRECLQVYITTSLARCHTVGEVKGETYNGDGEAVVSSVVLK